VFVEVDDIEGFNAEYLALQQETRDVDIHTYYISGPEDIPAVPTDNELGGLENYGIVDYTELEDE